MITHYGHVTKRKNGETGKPHGLYCFMTWCGLTVSDLNGDFTLIAKNVTCKRCQNTEKYKQTIKNLTVYRMLK